MPKSIKHFHDNVAQRTTVCGLTLEDVSSICGITRQAWHQARVSKNPAIKTVRRIGLMLAIPIDVLFDGTAEDVVRYPIPMWDYKAVLRANAEKIGMTSSSEIIPPRWDGFVFEFGPEKKKRSK